MLFSYHNYWLKAKMRFFFLFTILLISKTFFYLEFQNPDVLAENLKHKHGLIKILNSFVYIWILNSHFRNWVPIFVILFRKINCILCSITLYFSYFPTWSVLFRNNMHLLCKMIFSLDNLRLFAVISCISYFIINSSSNLCIVSFVD